MKTFLLVATVALTYSSLLLCASTSSKKIDLLTSPAKTSSPYLYRPPTTEQEKKLALACQKEDVTTIANLLPRTNPNLYCKDPGHSQLLVPLIHFALRSGNSAMIEILISNGHLKDPHLVFLCCIQNRLYRSTPEKYGEIITLLHTHAFSIDTPCLKELQTPLMVASRHSPLLVEKLLAFKANPCARDSQGKTPLMYCAQAGTIKRAAHTAFQEHTIMHHLLYAGADTTTRDDHNKTVFHYTQNKDTRLLLLRGPSYPRIKKQLESLDYFPQPLVSLIMHFIHDDYLDMNMETDFPRAQELIKTDDRCTIL